MENTIIAIKSLTTLFIVAAIIVGISMGWFHISGGKWWGFIGFMLTVVVLPALSYAIYLDFYK